MCLGLLVGWSLQLFWPQKVLPGGWSSCSEQYPSLPDPGSPSVGPLPGHEGMTRNPVRCSSRALTGGCWSRRALPGPPAARAGWQGKELRPAQQETASPSIRDAMSR